MLEKVLILHTLTKPIHRRQAHGGRSITICMENTTELPGLIGRHMPWTTGGAGVLLGPGSWPNNYKSYPSLMFMDF